MDQPNNGNHQEHRNQNVNKMSVVTERTIVFVMRTQTGGGRWVGDVQILILCVTTNRTSSCFRKSGHFSRATVSSNLERHLPNSIFLCQPYHCSISKCMIRLACRKVQFVFRIARPVTFNTIHSAGKQALDSSGVEGSSHQQGIAIAASEALHCAQNVFAEDFLEEVYDQDTVPTISRAYDMTPSRIHFGRLQSKIMPVARYAVQNEDGIWKAVTYEEFVQKHPKRTLPRSGIIDIMAASASMVYVRPSTCPSCGADEWCMCEPVKHICGELCGMRHLCRPVICGSSSASCTHGAVESVAEVFNESGLEQLCQRVPFVNLLEAPDGAPSCNRKKMYTAERCPANCGFIGNKCGAAQPLPIGYFMEALFCMLDSCTSSGYPARGPGECCYSVLGYPTHCISFIHSCISKT